MYRNRNQPAENSTAPCPASPNINPNISRNPAAKKPVGSSSVYDGVPYLVPA